MLLFLGWWTVLWRISKVLANHQHLSHIEANNLKYIEEVLNSRDHYMQRKCGNWKDSYLTHYKELLEKPDSQRQSLIFIPHLSGKENL